MGPIPREPPTGDPLVDQVQEDLRRLLHIKARLPLLRSLTDEFALMRDRMGTTFGVDNDIVMRIVNDSYDMLIIDLASLREDLASKRGLLNKLAVLGTARLVPFRPEECKPEAMWLVGSGQAREDIATWEGKESAKILRTRNDAFARLFPSGVPNNERDIQALIKRFRDDTEPTHRDRNHVRAHRFEEVARDAGRHFQTLEKAEQQVDVVLRYLRDLYLVLTRRDYPEWHAHLWADPKRAAEDLADIIAHGTINHAIEFYGATPGSEIGAPPWYWSRRERYFQQEEEADTKNGTSKDSDS